MYVLNSHCVALACRRDGQTLSAHLKDDWQPSVDLILLCVIYSFYMNSSDVYLCHISVLCCEEPIVIGPWHTRGARGAAAP